ncbi:MAG TPA: mandelate racemase/muconate lactonizing enzyme family protein [Bryobacteraceae bacterium]|nr:mandelate racemase/muconate lactonizing enzyme family protein [Bryobacteraceae bacterium]
MNHTAMRRRARLWSSVAPQTAAAAKPAALDIREIRHFPVREPGSGNRYSLLKVTTRSGLVGWGECKYDPGADLKAVQSEWVGKQANAHSTIAPSTPFRAALDIAMLDILGKAANAPVYRVLGGPTRNKVRAYSSPWSQEFPVAVIDIPAPAWRNQGKAYQNRIVELADAVPADRDFVLAGNGLLTPGDAASVARTVEAKHPLWFDEPCSHSNIDAIKKVADETVVPLGFGDGIEDPGVFQGLLREGLIDIVRPDIGIFGISGARRVAALAETYYVAVAPRHNGGPVGTAAAIHLAASIPNFFIQHVPLSNEEGDRAMRREIVSPAIEANSGGFLELTKSPGLGITVNEAALEKYHAA